MFHITQVMHVNNINDINCNTRQDTPNTQNCPSRNQTSVDCPPYVNNKTRLMQ